MVTVKPMVALALARLRKVSLSRPVFGSTYLRRDLRAEG
jgi:hypothetical protein